MTSPNEPPSGADENSTHPPAQQGSSPHADMTASPEELAASDLLDSLLDDPETVTATAPPGVPAGTDTGLVERMRAARGELRALDPPDAHMVDSFVAAALAAASPTDAEAPPTGSAHGQEPANAAESADGDNLRDLDVVRLGSRGRRSPRSSMSWVAGSWVAGAAAIVVLVVSGAWFLSNTTSRDDFASEASNEASDSTEQAPGGQQGAAEPTDGSDPSAPGEPESGESGDSAEADNRPEPEAQPEDTVDSPPDPSSGDAPDTVIPSASLLLLLWQQIQSILDALTP